MPAPPSRFETSSLALAPSELVGLTFPLDRLLDDASQFPPGNLPLEPAWEAHRRWRESERAALVGRFLVPSARVEALAELIERDGADGIELGVVVGGECSQLPLLLEGPAEVGCVELRAALHELPRWRERVGTAWLFVEGEPVAAVAKLRERDSRIGAKLRCGGLEAGAFPSAEAVAEFVAACVGLEVPFKATAGLHQPLRHFDPALGTFQHGFLNLLGATALAGEGAQSVELVRCLEIEQPEAWRQLGLTAATLGRARQWFTAFGTCSIEEPLAGLAAIGLLE